MTSIRFMIVLNTVQFNLGFTILDEQYTKTPFYGVKRMTAHLKQLGHPVGQKRVRRLLRQMGLD